MGTFSGNCHTSEKSYIQAQEHLSIKVRQRAGSTAGEREFSILGWAQRTFQTLWSATLSRSVYQQITLKNFLTGILWIHPPCSSSIQLSTWKSPESSLWVSVLGWLKWGWPVGMCVWSCLECGSVWTDAAYCRQCHAESGINVLYKKDSWGCK